MSVMQKSDMDLSIGRRSESYKYILNLPSEGYNIGLRLNLGYDM